MLEFKGLLAVFLASIFVFSVVAFILIQIGWKIIVFAAFVFVFSWAFPTAINHLCRNGY